MTSLQALQGITNYPIPQRVIERLAVEYGLSLTDDFTKDIATGREYQLTEADLYLWLVSAPSIAEAGIQYTFSATERAMYKRRSDTIRANVLGQNQQTDFGYKGESL